MGRHASFFILLFAALFLLVNGIEDLPKCASGWIRKNKTCYKAFNAKKTWQEARTHCETLSASLPVVLSSEENSFLSRMMLTPSSWIGASRCRTDEFCWPDGSSVRWAAWNQGEPNSVSEGCVNILFKINVTGKWNDASCTKKKSFICTRVLPDVPPIQDVIHVTPSSIIVMWAPSNPQVSQYFVMYKEKSNEHFRTLTVPANKASTRITGLTAAAEYVVTVKTGNVAGNSTVGPMRSFNTTRLSRPAIVDLSLFRLLKKADSFFNGYQSQLVLTCTATGNSPLTFTWIKERSILQTENNSSRYSDKLVLRGDREEHMGQITCRVTNLEGTSSRNIDIQASNAEAFSVVEIGEFQTVLAVLVVLAIILLVMVCILYVRWKRGCFKLRHIKAESMRIRNPRGKDYTEAPPTVQMVDVVACAKSGDEVNVDGKNAKDHTNTEYYTSLQRNADGTLVSSHPATPGMTYDYGDVDAEGGYPQSGEALNGEESYPHNHSSYRDSLHAFQEEVHPENDFYYNEGDEHQLGYHAYNEGHGYPPNDQVFVDEGNYQPLSQGHADASSYERLGQNVDCHDPNQSEGPMYGNCLDEQYPQDNHIPQNDEFPIYSNY